LAPVSSISPPARQALPDETSSFSRLLGSFGRQIEAGESLMRSAIASSRAGAVDGADLIALQAGVYRYSEAVDLAARIVDRATGSLKTVVQAQ
jgi:hypothetical protein